MGSFKLSQISGVLIGLADGTLAIGELTGPITIWNAQTGQIILTLLGHTDKVRRLKLLSDGNLASSSNDMSIKIWNTHTAQLVRTLSNHTNDVTSLEVYPTNGLLISGSFDKTIKVWNTTSGQLVSSFQMDGVVWGLALMTTATMSHADGNYYYYLIAEIGDTHLKVINPITGEILRSITESADIRRITLLDDCGGEYLLAVSLINSKIVVRSMRSGEVVRTISSSGGIAQTLLSLTGRCLLASGSEDGAIRFWQAGETGELLQMVKAHSGWIVGMAILSDGVTLVSTSSTNEIKVWRMDLN